MRRRRKRGRSLIASWRKYPPRWAKRKTTSIPFSLERRKEDTMRTYEQLSPEEKVKAFDKSLDGLLTDIVEGTIRFDDQANGDNLQARIYAAIGKANDMQTPWF